MLLKALKWGQNSILHHILLLMRVIKQASHHLSGPYATLKYTIGTSKFAWRGGKHSESAALQRLALRCLIRYIAVIWLYKKL